MVRQAGRRRWPALAVALFLMASCSQGMTLTEYFDELSGIRDRLDTAGEKVQKEADEAIQAATDEAAQLEVFRELLSKSVDAARVTVSELEDLDPPDAVAQAHEEFVAAYESMIAAMEAGVEASQDATTIDEAFQELFSDDAAEAGKRLDTACQDLQKVADDNEVDVDLRCDQTTGAGGEGGQAPAP